MQSVSNANLNVSRDVLTQAIPSLPRLGVLSEMIKRDKINKYSIFWAKQRLKYVKHLEMLSLNSLDR